MTENEALEKHKEDCLICRDKACKLNHKCLQQKDIEVYERLMQYEAIGTIEEFKALKEKSVAKKPITYTHTHRADCPNCRATVRGIDKPFGDYCSKCGIKLDWE